MNDFNFLRAVRGHRPTRNPRTAVEVLECGHDGQVVGRLGKWSGRAWDSPTHRNCARCREAALEDAPLAADQWRCPRCKSVWDAKAGTLCPCGGEDAR